MRKNGFSIVELAVVIVIVGLIIGGITIGASLVETAKVNQLVTEIAKFKSDIQTFRSKYIQLPGDASASIFTNGGDGDGTIDYPGGGATGEWTRVWLHLSEAGIVDGTYNGEKPNVSGSSGVFESDVANKAYFTVLYHANVGDHQIRIGHQDNGGALNSGGVFSPSFAQNIDQKIDDGFADSGDAGPIMFSQFEPDCLTNTSGPGNPYTSGDYNLTNDAGLCSMRIYLDY